MTFLRAQNLKTYNTRFKIWISTYLSTMAEKGTNDDEMRGRLDELTSMINQVYLPFFPADSKPDQRLQMEKFVRQVKMSLQQAYGNITIQVPELPEKSTEELCNDRALIETLIETIVSHFSKFSLLNFILTSNLNFNLKP